VFVNWTGNLAVGLVFPVMQAKLQVNFIAPFLKNLSESFKSFNTALYLA